MLAAPHVSHQSPTPLAALITRPANLHERLKRLRHAKRGTGNTLSERLVESARTRRRLLRLAQPIGIADEIREERLALRPQPWRQGRTAYTDDG